MTGKFIEISSGQDLLPTRYEIVAVEKNTYMLKTRDSYLGLFGTLEKWLENNNSMRESSYRIMLSERLRSMRKLLSESVTSDLSVDHLDIL